MFRNTNILVVDDEEIARENLKIVLEKEGAHVDLASTGIEGVKKIKKVDYDLVLTDLMLPGMNGIELLEQLREISPDTQSIVITGHATISTAVKAMQKGAHSYIAKPYELEAIRMQIHKALEQRALSVEVHRLRRVIEQGKQDFPMVGQSDELIRLKKNVRQLANMNCNVLIQGETGTGKELIARGIHILSPRSNERFMAINCGTFTAELMDKELFGHEKEAFTGAQKGQKGILEVADGGTVFFDEISELPLNMQVKLLRVLQERTFLRVGGTQEIPVDIRVIAASNCDLEQNVADGKFRQDLFYRLNVVKIPSPALRDHKEDIPVLIGHFLEKHRNSDQSISIIDQETIDLLMSYSFPGNVRELENIVQRALALARGDVFTPDLLPPEIVSCPKKQTISTLAELEEDHIKKVMKLTSGNKTKAASLLGIDRVSLWRKLKKYNMHDD